MSRPPSRGFTLVELLVVIGIIAILLGITIPAVMQALELAHRATCQNRLMHMASAAQVHEMNRGYLPGMQQAVGNQRAPWTVALFKYLGQQPIWDRWNDRHIAPGAASAPYVELMICPSSTTTSRDRASNSFVANVGFAPRSAGINALVDDPSPFFNAAGYSIPAPATRAPYDYWHAHRCANGLFTDHIVPASWKGVVPQRSVQVSHGDFRDGAGNTLLFSESLQAGDWNDAGPVQVFFPPTGFAWLYAADFGAPPPDPSVAVNPPVVIPPQVPVPPHAKINGSKDTPPFGAGVELLRPSSNHRAGVNVAFADGHVTFLRENIAYHVYQALMTPNSRDADTPNRFYDLTGSDY